MVERFVLFEIKKILFLQLVIAVLAFAIILVAMDWHSAKSVAIGGAIAIMPNLIFACLAGVPRRETKQILHAFYAGEALKLLSTAVLFFLALQVSTIAVTQLLIGFALGLTSPWLALLVVK